MRSTYMPQDRTVFNTLQTIALLGAMALIVWPALRRINGKMRAKHPIAMKEPAIDKVLKDSFPASDPPASRYFDIPVNRR